MHSRTQALASLFSLIALMGCGGLRTGRTPLAASENAPNFELPDQNGQLTTLASALQRGPAVVVFYRGHW